MWNCISIEMEVAVVLAAFEQIKNDALALARALDLPTGATPIGDRRTVGAAADPWTGPAPPAPPKRGRLPQSQVSNKELKKELAAYLDEHAQVSAAGFVKALENSHVRCSRERARVAFRNKRGVTRGRPKRVK